MFTYLAVASAGFANLVMMRRKEFTAGITVSDEQTGKELGKSQVAAKKAVVTTGLSRPILASTMFIPAGLRFFLEKKKLMPRGRAGQIGTELLLCAIGLYSGLMLAVSFFPQNGTLKVEHLEERFQKLEIEGEHVKSVVYNKGL